MSIKLTWRAPLRRECRDVGLPSCQMADDPLRLYVSSVAAASIYNADKPLAGKIERRGWHWAAAYVASTLTCKNG